MAKAIVFGVHPNEYRGKDGSMRDNSSVSVARVSPGGANGFVGSTVGVYRVGKQVADMLAGALAKGPVVIDFDVQDVREFGETKMYVVGASVVGSLREFITAGNPIGLEPVKSAPAAGAAR